MTRARHNTVSHLAASVKSAFADRIEREKRKFRSQEPCDYVLAVLLCCVAFYSLFVQHAAVFAEDTECAVWTDEGGKPHRGCDTTDRQGCDAYRAALMDVFLCVDPMSFFHDGHPWIYWVIGWTTVVCASGDDPGFFAGFRRAAKERDFPLLCGSEDREDILWLSETMYEPAFGDICPGLVGAQAMAIGSIVLAAACTLRAWT